MPIVNYAFDPTGVLPANLVTNEQHALNLVNSPTYRWIVPRYAPYFADSLVVTLKQVDGSVKTLVPNVDYYTSHWFISASRACAKPVWGSITILDNTLTGILGLQYQTIGGNWVLSDTDLANFLANQLANPRTVSWESIVNLPTAFPVINHQWDLVDMVGASDLVKALKDIEARLRDTTTGGLADHLTDHANPHQTNATQVGLGNVKNYGIATTTQAVDGSNATSYITPSTLVYAINALVRQDFNTHLGDFANPHKVSAAQVGAYTTTQTDQLLNVKLDKTAQAADSALLSGMTVAQLTAQILGGTAANASTLQGKTVADIVTQVSLSTVEDSNHLQGQTLAQVIAAAQAGTAANANTLGNKTLSQIQALWQADSVANANTVGGKTVADILTAAASGTSANSNALSGQSLNQIRAMWQGDTVANANALAGMTVAQLTAQILSGTASNANTVGGKTVADIVSQITSGTVQNSTTVGGKTYQDLRTEWQNGTSANSTLFAGMDVPQLTASILSKTDAKYAPQALGASATGQTAGSYYTTLAKVPSSTTRDVFLAVGGTEGVAAANGALYLVRYSPKNQSLVWNTMSDVDVGTQFGFATTGTGVTIYALTTENHNPISVTLYDQSLAQVALGTDLATAPSNWVLGTAKTSAALAAAVADYDNKIRQLAATVSSTLTDFATRLKIN